MFTCVWVSSLVRGARLHSAYVIGPSPFEQKCPQCCTSSACAVVWGSLCLCVYVCVVAWVPMRLDLVGDSNGFHASACPGMFVRLAPVGSLQQLNRSHISQEIMDKHEALAGKLTLMTEPQPKQEDNQQAPGDASGQVAGEPQPAGASASASSSGSSSAPLVVSAGVRLTEYSANKLVDGMAKLRKKGFNAGSTVSEKDSTTDAWTIIDVRDTDDKHIVHLADAMHDAASGSPQSQKDVDLDDFLAKYVVADLSKVVVVHPGWPKKAPSTYGTYTEALVKGTIMAAVGRVGAHYGQGLESMITVYSRPSRCVKAAVAIKKNAVVLVPESLRVISIKPGDTVPEMGVEVEVGESGKFGSPMRFFLSPSFSEDFVCPSWAVRGTEKEAEANMEWGSIKVTEVVVMEGPTLATSV